ncbi:hypothetical protein [Novosphingobium sp.]|uniref:hypothetical protein n=1 Tax=Novosphingobium sp. TaxID=1874826 RepID=UPI003B517455
MKIGAIVLIAGGALIATAALADEIHDKTQVADHDLKEAIGVLHMIQAEHGPDFGGHFARAEQLARQADAEREAGMHYYRARHPGWR